MLTERLTPVTDGHGNITIIIWIRIFGELIMGLVARHCWGWYSCTLSCSKTCLVDMLIGFNCAEKNGNVCIYNDGSFNHLRLIDHYVVTHRIINSCFSDTAGWRTMNPHDPGSVVWLWLRGLLSAKHERRFSYHVEGDRLQYYCVPTHIWPCSGTLW